MFSKIWEKKVKHESKFQSDYPLNLQKYVKSANELRFVQTLKQEAEANYHRNTLTTYPNTRKNPQHRHEPRETALATKLVGNYFHRGLVVDGRYTQYNIDSQ